MEYRIGKKGLLERLAIWDGFLRRKVHLVACGGTALTLLDVKPSTKGIDLKEFSHIYLGVLNYYDIIISKLFRGTTLDMEDCMALIQAKKKDIDTKALIRRFDETALYDISEEKARRNLAHFEKLMGKKG